jgi:hypothetical protein
LIHPRAATDNIASLWALEKNGFAVTSDSRDLPASPARGVKNSFANCDDASGEKRSRKVNPDAF